MSDREPILIAGAGIGGLALAALLRRRGRACLVLERASELAPVGAGIILQPNAVRALRIGGIEEVVTSRGARMRTLEIRDAAGRILSAMPAESLERNFGAGIIGFHRATLHEALLALAPPGALRLGSEARAFHQDASGVSVELANGERVAGAALVGADGLRSNVRAALLGDGEPRYSGYTSWRGVANASNLWPEGAMCESWGRGARFGLVGIDGGRVYWFATANLAAGGKDRARAELLSRFANWHDPIARVIEATPEGAILRTDISDRDPAARWSRGRVTLLGDAAHPMTPNLGQGGCQAIEDAVVLDLCLESHSNVEAAFEDYEARRFARTARVVEEARRFGRIGQIESSPLRFLRDFALRATPNGLTLRSIRWLYDFDV